MKNEQQQYFITCPECNGSGEKKSGIACKNCGGTGMGTFFNGYFLYWGLSLKRADVDLRKVKRDAHLLLNFFALFIGILGFVFLGILIFAQKNQTDLDIVSFLFRYKHPYILMFWIGVLTDMFIVYRLYEEKRREHKIKEFKTNKGFSYPDNWKELRKSKKKLDVSSGFGFEALKVVEDSMFLAEKLKHKEDVALHLFFSALRNGLVSVFFARLSADMNEVAKKARHQLLLLGSIHTKSTVTLSNELKTVLIESYIEAANYNQNKVEAINFILPSQTNNKVINDILYDFEIDKDKTVNCLKWFKINDEMVKNYHVYKKMARYKPSTHMDRAYTAIATPILNHFSHDLTLQAKWGRLELCVAREKEMEEIFDHFKSGHTGVILVGEPGTGKNAIAGGIAQLMVKEEVPHFFKDKRLVELDIARLLSGAEPSEAQERLLTALNEISRSGNIVLYIENIENIIGIQAGEGESLDLSEVLAGEIEKNLFFCVASATPRNYSEYIENKPVGRVLEKIDVKEPEMNAAIQILESKVGYLEARYQIYFSYNAIEEAVKLTSKYIHDKFLPAKAIEVLESASTKVAKQGFKVVARADIRDIVSEITNIPVDKISEQEGEMLLNLEAKLHERMVGQDEAIKMISASLRRARVEMRDAKRPIASFLFLGPTGVGKTELAKSVSEVYFGSEGGMIRLDMSEYQHPDSVKKMIGEGDESGYLTEAVRKAPFSLVLLDEFEKAHPEILNLFLQVMDDGRLTDGQGRTIDFTNTIIIATSNAGALFIEEEIMKGTETEKIKQALINEYLNKVMKPELINRFDGIVVFKPLTENDILSIAKLLLAETKKMLGEKGIGLEYNEEGLKILAKEGFDPKFGARPMRRVLQDKVENIIANKLLAGELDRRDTVLIDANADIAVEKGREL